MLYPLLWPLYEPICYDAIISSQPITTKFHMTRITSLTSDNVFENVLRTAECIPQENRNHIILIGNCMLYLPLENPYTPMTHCRTINMYPM